MQGINELAMTRNRIYLFRLRVITELGWLIFFSGAEGDGLDPPERGGFFEGFLVPVGFLSRVENKAGEFVVKGSSGVDYVCIILFAEEEICDSREY